MASNQVITPLQLPYFTPSGIKKYEGPSHFRAVTQSEPPKLTKLVADRFGANFPKYWVDSSAVNRLSRAAEQQQRSGFRTFEGFNQSSGQEQTTEYTFFEFSVDGTPVTAPIDSPDFYRTYAISPAHNSIINAMREYSHLYEKVGAPITYTATLADSEAAAVQFPTKPMFDGYKSYPVVVPSTHVFFVVGKDVCALPTEDFLRYFAPRADNYDDMLVLVQEALNQTQLSAKSRVQMIRLAVIEKPNQTLI